MWERFDILHVYLLFQQVLTNALLTLDSGEYLSHSNINHIL